jgi:ABC-2 type transport system permease protein
MIKVLLKKQWLAATAIFTQGKNGQRRSPKAILGFSILLLYGLGAMGVMFWEMADMMCAPLVHADLAWVYFAFVSLLATCIMVVIGMFAAKSTLYEAKDNDLMFSMPIPSWVVLLSRMFVLYAISFLFGALVLVPAFIQYYIIAGVAPLSLLAGVILLFIVPLGGVAICNILGALLAWITVKLPFKNFFTTVLFIAFFVGYMLVYMKVNEYLGYVLGNGESVGAMIKTTLYPFSQVGYAATGKIGSLLLAVLMFGGFFGVVYAVLSKTYFQIATTKKGERRAKYKARKQVSRSVNRALLRRECLRLIKSPAYLLNSSMGSLMMVMVAAMMVATGNVFGLTESVLETMPDLADNVFLLVALVICFMSSSNFITACAVSLEGENITAIQSLPVDEWFVLRAKMYLHILFTAIPAMLLGGAMAWMVGLAWWETAIVLVTAVISTVMFAAFGLMVNLKLPNLHWTNETAAVKQSASSAVAMFGGWGISLLPLGAFFLFGKYMYAWLFALIVLVLFVTVATVTLLWIYKKGTKIFRFLN